MKPRPVRTQWVKRDGPQSAPETPRQLKAKNLPMPGPGIVVTVPLHLLPEYLELYGLRPAGIQEPKVAPKDGPGQAILLVRRTSKGAE